MYAADGHSRLSGDSAANTTIGQAFPELSAKIQPAYRDVSVRQLLTHSGGVPPYRTRESLQWMLALKGTATEQRYALLERVAQFQD